MKKVTTGMELLVADPTVADVNLRLTLYRFKLNVVLETKLLSSVIHFTFLALDSLGDQEACSTYPINAYMNSFRSNRNDNDRAFFLQNKFEIYHPCLRRFTINFAW
jgi:hypothetical protein